MFSRTVMLYILTTENLNTKYDFKSKILVFKFFVVASIHAAHNYFTKYPQGI